MLAFSLPISKCLLGLHCFHNKQCMEFKQVEGRMLRGVYGGGGGLWLGWHQAPLGPKPVGTGMTLPHLEVGARAAALPTPTPGSAPSPGTEDLAIHSSSLEPDAGRGVPTGRGGRD